MSSKLIKTLALANGVILFLSIALVVYLFFFEPIGATKWVSSRALTEHSAIRSAGVSADVLTHADSLYRIANEGMRASVVTAGTVIVVLLFIGILCVLNFMWLRELRRVTHDAS